MDSIAHLEAFLQRELSCGSWCCMSESVSQWSGDSQSSLWCGDTNPLKTTLTLSHPGSSSSLLPFKEMKVSAGCRGYLWAFPRGQFQISVEKMCQFPKSPSLSTRCRVSRGRWNVGETTAKFRSKSQDSLCKPLTKSLQEIFISIIFKSGAFFIFSRFVFS